MKLCICGNSPRLYLASAEKFFKDDKYLFVCPVCRRHGTKFAHNKSDAVRAWDQDISTYPLDEKVRDCMDSPLNLLFLSLTDFI